MYHSYYSPLFTGHCILHEYFSASDSKENFIKNQKIKGVEWEYHSKPISYVRNTYGHRCGELSDLNLDNYILVTGCSLTEGIAISVEDRYSDILSNMLNCDMYNLGISGTGNDIIFYNLVSWFGTFKAKPKLVIIQWTSDNRYSIFNSENNRVNSYGPWNSKGSNFLVEVNNNNYFQSKSIMFGQLIRKIIDVPIIEIFPFYSNIYNQNDIKYKLHYETDKLLIDFGRDLLHPGSKSNKLIAEKLYQIIKKEELL